MGMLKSEDELLAHLVGRPGIAGRCVDAYAQRERELFLSG